MAPDLWKRVLAKTSVSSVQSMKILNKGARNSESSESQSQVARVCGAPEDVTKICCDLYPFISKIDRILRHHSKADDVPLHG